MAHMIDMFYFINQLRENKNIKMSCCVSQTVMAQQGDLSGEG
jgi:hypothetical protein